METDLELRDYILVILRRRWLLLGIIAGVLIVTLVSTVLTKPVYTSTVQISLGNYSNRTYTTPSLAREIILGTEVISRAVETLYPGVTSNDLASFKTQIDVAPVKDTGMILITCKENNPVKAKNFVKVVADLFLQKAMKSFNDYKAKYALAISTVKEQQKLFEKSIQRNQQLLYRLQTQNNINALNYETERNFLYESIANDEKQLLDLQNQLLQLEKEMLGFEEPQIINRPTEPKNPDSPNLKLNLIVALAASLMFGLIVVFVVEYFSLHPIKASDIRSNTKGSNSGCK